MSLAIRGESRSPDDVEHRECRQGLAVAVCGVLDDRELAGVAEDLVKGVRGVSFGGDDDLGAERRVLVGDVGVARDALINEVPRQRAPVSYTHLTLPTIYSV